MVLYGHYRGTIWALPRGLTDESRKCNSLVNARTRKDVPFAVIIRLAV